MIAISVIIPVYNCERYIKATLECLLKQTFTDFEAIVIDDGSKDSSAALVNEFILNYPSVNIKYYHQKNQGVSVARNLGLSFASGQYICFLDSDDIIVPDFLNKMYNHIVDEKSDIVYCGYNKFKYDNIILKEYELSSYIKDNLNGLDIIRSYLMKKINIHICTLLIKKELLDNYNINFPAHQHYAEDILFFMKCFYHANKMTCVKEELFWYRIHSNSALQNCGNIKMFGTVLCYSKFKKELKPEDKRIKNLINRYSIPQAIMNVLVYWIISTKDDTLFERLLKFKTIRQYLKIGLITCFCSFSRFKMGVKITVVLLDSAVFYKLFKKTSHDYID